MNKTICVIGIWHLGIINAIGFCEKGYNVIGVDFDDDNVKKLNNGIPPLYEPGLKSLLVKHLKNENLRFTSSSANVAGADVVVIAYDSPVNDKDEVDISPVIEAAQQAALFLKNVDVPIVITSQVPLGSCEIIEADILAVFPNWKSGIVYVPENLKLGDAISRFLEPDMLVLGSRPEIKEAALSVYEKFDAPKLPMNLKSAEMVKHALNTFLATSITFINEIANLSDLLGADAVQVGKALKHDTRIGKKALMMPGLGFSGGTLARDVTQLRKFSKELNYDAKLLDSIVSINEGTFDEVINKLTNRLSTLQGKSIGILGLTYKPGTSTVRRSPAVKIIEKLNAAGANCVGYDPMASDEELKEYNIIRKDSVFKVAQNADALVIVTEWSEFKDLNFVELAKQMKTAIIIDSKNILQPDIIIAAGFDYQGFGRKS